MTQYGVILPAACSVPLGVTASVRVTTYAACLHHHHHHHHHRHHQVTHNEAHLTLQSCVFLVLWHQRSYIQAGGQIPL